MKIRIASARPRCTAASMAALGISASAPLLAQDAPAAEPDENIDEVVVTGTRVADAHAPRIAVACRRVVEPNA